MASSLVTAQRGSRVETTPAPTKVALVATLLITGAVLAAFLRTAPSAEIEPRRTSYALVVLSFLFLLRVAGQLTVVARGPRWLPPMLDWNLAPYRIVLPAQIAFLVVMGLICGDLFRSEGAFATPSPGFGRAAIWFSYVYAAAIGVRYVLRMTRRRDQRWFGGTIPMVFHLVLASFVYVYGSFHASD
jgi:hypothetical protein